MSLVEREERSFVFSTPRLAREGWLNLNVPFRHHGLDTMFPMRREPQSLDVLFESLSIDKNDAELFSTFFTEETPPPSMRYTG